MGQFHGANLFHPFLPGLLFFKKFTFTRNITAIAFGKNVLSQGTDVLTGNDLASDCGLDGDFKKLPGNDLAQFFHKGAAPYLGAVPMDNGRQRVDRIPI